MAATYDLFISYADADRPWVDGFLLDALTSSGVTYKNETAFELGVPKLEQFERGVRESSFTLLVISHAYLIDSTARLIDLIAQTSGLDSATWPVIPLLLDRVDLPPRLAVLPHVDATDPNTREQNITALCEKLVNRQPGQSAPPRCPYPGVEPFKEADQAAFFGRSGDVQEIVQRLKLHRFLAIIGRSGSGKSSLVSAGLIPAMRQSHLFGPGEWAITTVRPDDDPVEALSTALRGAPAERRLVLVDPFEEVFTRTPPERVEPFCRALEAFSATSGCFAVVVMRADFYTEVIETSLGKSVEAYQVTVKPLQGDALRQAIVGPAEKVGVYIEPALVERLLADAADEPGVLPLIQETLVLLWERLQRRYLPLQSYEALVISRQSYGEETGTRRSGLQIAMAQRADAAVGRLNERGPAYSIIARRILLRLVQFGEGRSDTRRQRTVDQLRAPDDDRNVFDATLAHLISERLLTVDAGDDGQPARVDLAHEALARGWPTLRGWIRLRREAELTRRRLEARVDEWTRLGQGSAALLDEVGLAEAERWLESQDAVDLGPPADLQRLVTASRTAVEDARNERFEAHEREVAQARHVAEERQRRIEVEVRGRRRSTILAIVLALVAVALGVAGGEATRERGLADDAARLASARELVASANAALSSDPELSALLAQRALVRAGAGSGATQAEEALRLALADSRTRHVITNPSVRILAASISPDGRFIATGDEDGAARVWSAPAFDGPPRELRSPGPQQPIHSLAFDPSGRYLLTGSDDAVARIWELSTGRLVELKGHLQRVRSVTFAPAGPFAVTASDDGTAAVWSLSTAPPQLVHQVQHRPPAAAGAAVAGPPPRVTSAALSPDQRQLATAGTDRRARVWDVESGALLRTFERHTGAVNSIAFDPSGTRIVTGSQDGTARIWDVRSGETLIQLSGHAGPVWSAAFSPDGRLVVTASDDRSARVWNATTGHLLLELSGHAGAVTGAMFDPHDGRTIVTASGDGTARVWAVSPETLVTSLRGHTASVTSAAFSPDGKQIVTASEDGTARLWDADSGDNLGQFLHPGGPRVWSAVFAPTPSSSGALLLTAAEDGSARLWTIGSPTAAAELRGARGATDAAVFSPDGQHVLTGGDTRTAVIWDLTDKPRVARTLQDHRDAVFGVAYSSSGGLAATASADGTARIWEPASGRTLQVLQGHAGWVNAVAFSPDDRLVATASQDATARLWDVNTGRFMRELRGHTGEVTGVGFSPDGRLLVTASRDGTARIWEVASGKFLSVISGLTGEVNSAAFSPDGGRIVIAGKDGIAQIHRCEDCDSTQQLLDLTRTRLTRALTPHEEDVYLHARGT